MATMTYLQAISDGLREEMRADERVLVMGEDIGAFGGAFKVTDGFIDEFGADRVMDTPLAESGDHRHRGRRGGRRACGRSARCSSPTSSPAASTSSSTSPGKMYYRQGLPVHDHRAAAHAAAASRAARSTRRTRRRGSCTRPG